MEKKINNITLTDEKGKEIKFKVIEKLVVNDKNYLIVTPIDEDRDEAIALLMNEKDNGECAFIPVSDEKELEAISNAFEESQEE